jgi:hypothetical protein
VAHAFTIRSELNLVCFRFHDTVSIADARKAFEDYVTHPGFDPAYVMLTDARRVTNIEANFSGILAEVQALARYLRRFEKGALSVVLVSGNTTFGMVRMLEQILDFTSRIKMRVAWTEQEVFDLAGVTGLEFSALFDF